jgi:hypothetical protein
MDDRLLSIGFEAAGDWELVGDRIKAHLERDAGQQNVLYAFVRNAEVMYVGQSERTLRERMSNYASPSVNGNSTNQKIKRNILDLLRSGESVEIFALPDNGLMHYGQFHLNLAAGLEKSIIRKLSPPWNWKSKNGEKFLVTERDDVIEKVQDPEAREEQGAALPAPAMNAQEETQQGKQNDVHNDTEEERSYSGDVDDETPPEPAESLQPADPPETIGSFEFKLEPSYWREGFFNGRNAGSPLLGEHGAKIEIFYGDEKTPFLGSINRRNTGPGQTPRISSGAALKPRFQRLPEGYTMVVDVYSPLSIRIRPKTE